MKLKLRIKIGNNQPETETNPQSAITPPLIPLITEREYTGGAQPALGAAPPLVKFSTVH
ncbi:MAG: hypothetical protein LBG72_08325 [Spirochaetaceae bacterium]|nr:hypothetical protein [Spirochaetaceae bacterium]